MNQDAINTKASEYLKRTMRFLGGFALLLALGTHIGTRNSEQSKLDGDQHTVPSGSFHLTHIDFQGNAIISHIICWYDQAIGRYNYYDSESGEVIFTSDESNIDMGVFNPNSEGDTGICIGIPDLKLTIEEVSYIGSPVVLTAQQIDAEKLYRESVEAYKTNNYYKIIEID